jgi:3-oxoacyl-[acyl-carrier protein] reductase
MISLLNKNALIGGSTQGIGLAAAIQFSKLGASCTLMARNPTALDSAISKLDVNQGQQHSYLVADFEHTEQVLQAITQLQVQNKQIDIWVNNTGGPAPGLLHNANVTQLQEAFNMHVINSQQILQAILPWMKKNKWGRIVNVISSSVRIPVNNLGVSNTIRGAMASWAKTISNELAPFGITVNNVLPGYIFTGRIESLIDATSNRLKLSTEQVTKNMLAEIPMGRFGQPEEMAQVIAFLASNAASYITGESIRVDGGKTGSI